MVNLTGEYDPDAEASTGFEPLPAGQYVARLIDASREPISRTKDCGDCLALTWKIEGGEFDGRLFWQRLNLWWNGPEKTPGKVKEIANGEFRAIRDATGVPMPQSTDDLLERPCLVALKIKQDEGFNPKNEVTSVKALNGGGAPTAAPSHATASASAASAAPAQSRGSNVFQRAASR